MGKVIGIGGVFVRARDPERLYQWYASHLGMRRDAGGIIDFAWRNAEDPDRTGKTVWHLFPPDTGYFGATQPAFMVNYIVEDLDGLLSDLRAAGAAVDDPQGDTEYGRFAWVTDPEGNRAELWEPPQ